MVSRVVGLEEVGWGVAYVVVCVLESATFDNGDDEETEENVPQVKGELAPEMGADVARLLRVVVVLLAVDA